MMMLDEKSGGIEDITFHVGKIYEPKWRTGRHIAAYSDIFATTPESFEVQILD